MLFLAPQAKPFSSKVCFLGRKLQLTVQIYTAVGTARNVSDVTQAHALLHGDETAAIGDAGYQGVRKRPENVGKAVKWHVAMKLQVQGTAQQ